APVLVATPVELEAGIPYGTIGAVIDQHHPTGPINRGNITLALQAIGSLQARLNIKPIILDYDQTRRRLNVVDRGFLVWLKYQDRSDLLAAAGLPSSLNPDDAQLRLEEETAE